MKVLFHVNENDRWNIAFGNITNLIKDVGEDVVEIVVLANGHAVESLVDDEKIKTMKEVIGKGVRFLICRNSLKMMCAGATACIDMNSIPSFLEVVPAGITEIIRRQMDGYAYVKP